MFDYLKWALVDVLDLKWTDALMVAAAALFAFTGGPFGIAVAAILMAFEKISLGIRALGYFMSLAIEQVDALGGVSEETAKRFGTSLDSMTDAYGELAKCSMPDAVVSEDDLTTIDNRIQDVHDTLVNNLDTKRNQELANIDLMRDFLPQESIDAAKERVNKAYDDQITSADQAQSQLRQIYATAAEEHRGLTDEEAAQVKGIQDQLQSDLIQSSGATAEELETINRNMANNNTQAAVEAASKIIQAKAQERDETVAAAWQQYDQTMEAARQMLEAGDITQEQYDATGQAALDMAQTTQNAANEAYYGENGVINKTREGLGENAKYIDETNGEIKNNWQVKWDEIKAGFGEAIDGIKTKCSDGLTEMQNSVRTGFQDMESKVNTFAWNTQNRMSDWYWNNIGPTLNNLKEKSRNVGNSMTNFLSDPVGNIKRAWYNISVWFYNNVQRPIEETFRGIKRFFVDTMNNIIGRLNSWRIYLPRAVQQVTGWSSIGFNIPYLASGGFVDEGQLFVAREAEPEMVETISGRTAVANNDQIVQGIASGVASANAEQNNLLREQNSLLRKLLAKSSTASISATDISRGLDEASRISGRPLVTA